MWASRFFFISTAFLDFQQFLAVWSTPAIKIKPRITLTAPAFKNSSIITNNQSNVNQPPTKNVYQIGGIDIVCENKATTTADVAVAIFKNAEWDTMSVRDKNDLISLMSYSTNKVQDTSIDTTELEKLYKTHSLKLLIAELKTNFARYNLRTAFFYYYYLHQLRYWRDWDW